jgi:hypothetical protein
MDVVEAEFEILYPAMSLFIFQLSGYAFAGKPIFFLTYPLFTFQAFAHKNSPEGSPSGSHCAQAFGDCASSCFHAPCIHYLVFSEADSWFPVPGELALSEANGVRAGKPANVRARQICLAIFIRIKYKRNGSGLAWPSGCRGGVWVLEASS